MNKAIAALIVAAFQWSGSASATVIDFEALSQNNALINSAGPIYSEDGFSVAGVSGPNALDFVFFGALHPQYLGTTALALNATLGNVVLTRDGGGEFDAVSIQVAEIGPPPQTPDGFVRLAVVRFAGVRSDGTAFTADLVSDGAFGLQTFVFPNTFTNLVSLVWLQQFPNFHQFDNVTVTPLESVPIPAALPLFATGLGVMGLLGWRRKRKAAAALAAP